MMFNSDNEDHQVGHGPVDISDDEGWKPIDNVGMEVQTSFLEDGDLKPETNTVGMQTEKVKRDAPEKTAYTDVQLGKRTWANGEVYEGEWRAGQRHGRGMCYYADGECYVGEWVEGVRQGTGSLADKPAQ